MLIALAMILSYAESLVPAFFAVPGMKIGLTNVVVLFAFYGMDEKAAFLINLIRIVLVGILFGSGVSLIYSLAGGLLSFLVIFLLKKTGKFQIVTVSMAGGIFHNIGQILVAMALLGTKAIAWYLLILWFFGMGAGLAVGVIGAILVRRLERIVK